MASTVFLKSNNALAESFLWLPFSESVSTPGDCRGDCALTSVCIFCKWTCPDDVDGVYNHHATDYGCTANETEIRSAADGVVEAAFGNYPPGIPGAGGGYGNHVIIRHANGYKTWYAHLKRDTVLVSKDDVVLAGALLGTSDNSGRSSGPHLHFELRNASGSRVNPYGSPPDYDGGCGPGALWATCPPTPFDPSTLDRDGDGVTVADGDCDDADAGIAPGIMEPFCNGVDENCDGVTDGEWETPDA
ncbi:MAG: M23 family metallopeptidase, partial [Candidatus Peregrinibacteria bacterium]|nr:M23 family metallopeptidase [Candidatus Peregrinibacteria bacterium]